MLSADLSIAHLHVRIHCESPACCEGIEALTALFEHTQATEHPDICFTLRMVDGGTVLTCNGEHIWQGEEAGEVVAAFEWALYNRAINMLHPRFISLHAATVGWQGHAITIAGASGAGKSSLCTAALLHGADYFSDEYSLLDQQGRITPFPRPLQWGGETHPAFTNQAMHDSGLFAEGRYSFTAHDGQAITSLLWHPRHLAGEPVPLSLLLLPRFDAAAEPATCEPLARSQALMELAAEMHHKLPVRGRLRELNSRIPAATRMLRLVFSDVHAAWGQVEQLLTSRG